jgi:hypothetical protein
MFFSRRPSDERTICGGQCGARPTSSVRGASKSGICIHDGPLQPEKQLPRLRPHERHPANATQNVDASL